MSVLNMRELWQQVYLAAIRAGSGHDSAVWNADAAVDAFNKRTARGEL